MDEVLMAVDSRGVATVTLNRPAFHNAIDQNMAKLLLKIFDQIRHDKSIKVVILQANGMAFSIGNDMPWLFSVLGHEVESRNQVQLITDVLQSLNTLPQPTIAKIQGSAFGVGVGLVACCDFAVSVQDALFSIPDVKVGMVGAIIAPYLVDIFGPRNMRRYMLSAERFNATRAKRLGLLNQVCKSDDLAHAVGVFLSQLLLNAPSAMQESKYLINALQDIRNQSGSAHGVNEFVLELGLRVRKSEEAKEGVGAFIEQRRPNWISLE